MGRGFGARVVQECHQPSCVITSNYQILFINKAIISGIVQQGTVLVLLFLNLLLGSLQFNTTFRLYSTKGF